MPDIFISYSIGRLERIDLLKRTVAAEGLRLGERRVLTGVEVAVVPRRHHDIVSHTGGGDSALRASPGHHGGTFGESSVQDLVPADGVAASGLKEPCHPVDQIALQLVHILKALGLHPAAAVISPIGTLNYKGKDIKVADGKVGATAQKLYDTLYGIQTGSVEDFMGWTYPLGLKA